MGKYSNQVKTNEAWLPMIPSQWELKKIKWSFKERSEKGYPDEPLLVASQNMGVVPKNVYGKRTVEALKDLDKLKLVKVGDYVVSLRSFQGGIEYAYYQGIISPAYTIMRPNPDFCSAYYKFLFKSAPFIKLLTTCVTGIREGQNIDYGKLKNHYIPVPPRAEQDQIVRFLDWKVSEINKLIGIRQKEIQELEELKDNIIFQATTSGLNKNVPMKRTGNRWLGTIPEQWDVVQVRRAYSVILGKMLSLKPLDFTYTYENYVCAKDVHFDGVNLSNLKKMWFSTAEKKQYKIKTGDLLVVEGGAGAGNAALIDEPLEHEVFVQNSIHIIRPKNNLTTNKFLAYWIKSLVRRDYMKFVCNVATIPHYTKDKVMSTVMPLPPLKEQQEIVRYLADESLKIENLINKKHSQITVLQELKGSLISDVVTGKIDVRNIPVPAYEHVDDLTADGGEGNDEEPRIPGEED
ncbi:restriction endonuclease subunit S [Megasphaera elsdenii]|uniref:restriction endonuclease subunit S n=1 Tax=Megasphaera elsdenii TaxID=907 RepID=UPI0009B852EA|nr:restriction endonuclease subunit S [Megasphaera elsdenii]